MGNNNEVGGQTQMTTNDKEYMKLYQRQRRARLKSVKKEGLSRKLISFELEGKAIPRHGYKILNENQPIGTVTSGMFSPLLNKPIGLGYVEISQAKIGTQFTIDIRGRKFPAVIVKPPFYNRDY